ncbi:MAG: pilin [Candidatus Parcubacteria bacterium]|nr:pilin [Candidatus Parcubacteria bacterium]
MHSKTKIFTAFIFSCFFFFSEKVLAQNEGYIPLASIPTVPTDSAPTLAIYMKGIFTATIGLAIVFAVLMIVIGGIQYIVAQTPFSVGEGKNRISSAITGIFIILISSVLLNTLNPGLLRIGLNLDRTIFDNYTPQNEGNTSNTPHYCKNVGLTNTRMCYTTKEECDAQPGFIPFSSCDLSTEATTIPLESGNEGDNRKILTDTGHITINAGSDRTQLAGVRPETLNEVKRVQQECNCDIVVTGGSESTGVHNCSNPSNPNHCNGKKVDLGTGGALDNHIIDHPEQYTNIGKRGDGAIQYQSKTSGAIYALESNHWDITVP